jgi:hypothetical protein
VVASRIQFMPRAKSRICSSVSGWKQKSEGCAFHVPCDQPTITAIEQSMRFLSSFLMGWNSTCISWGHLGAAKEVVGVGEHRFMWVVGFSCHCPPPFSLSFPIIIAA